MFLTLERKSRFVRCWEHSPNQDTALEIISPNIIVVRMGKLRPRKGGRDMLSSGSDTYFGERGIRVWISSSACREGDLRQVTCLSGLWFSHVDVGLIVRAVVGIRRGGVSASVCTVPHVG